ncbi:colipase [Patagioenas fasciata monilis]|uniref:Colipase n=1 Tax=Patagioenas fasciata monilis TaxID=372326 RepID=A0A1V4KX07_PATFA|nr:colipase [Patagioenas fasciata monilis]
MRPRAPAGPAAETRSSPPWPRRWRSICSWSCCSWLQRCLRHTSEGSSSTWPVAGRIKGGTERDLVLMPRFTVQSTGELCLQSVQCKSGCCHRQDGLSLARCAPKAAESQDCSPKSLYGVYYRCPCESGLTCDADKTIIGSITNSDFGLCTDPNESR